MAKRNGVSLDKITLPGVTEEQFNAFRNGVLSGTLPGASEFGPVRSAMAKHMERLKTDNPVFLARLISHPDTYVAVLTLRNLATW